MLGKRTPVELPRLELVQVDVPSPPPGWRSVRVRLSGVCGSDLGVLFGGVSLRLSAYHTLPAIFGHEVVGEADGTRVVLEPTLACRDRGLQPCPECARGDEHLCTAAMGDVTASGMIGYDRDLPGGWSESLIARAERLHQLPDDVPDERAVLAEPLAVALRGIRRLLARASPGRVLVVGSGSLGLITIQALRLTGFDGEVHVAARYPRQAEAARRLGADHVHGDAAAAARNVGARSFPAILGPPGWRGGFDAVVDAAGSRSSLAAASWFTAEGGSVLVLGGTDYAVHDFTPHWFREVTLLGSYIYRSEEFADAVRMLAEAPELDGIGVDRYPLEGYRGALRALRSRRAVKVAFDPRV